MNEKITARLSAAEMADVNAANHMYLSGDDVVRRYLDAVKPPMPEEPFALALVNRLVELQQRLDDIEARASILRTRYLGDAPPMGLQAQQASPEMAVMFSTLERIAECYATATRVLDHLHTLNERL